MYCPVFLLKPLVKVQEETTLYPVLLFLFACVVSLLVPLVILLLVTIVFISLISLFLDNFNAAPVPRIMSPLLDCHSYRILS